MSDQAIIATVDRTEPIEGADRIQVAYVLGDRVIVSKDVNVGYVGVYFPEGLQLDDEYAKTNNLYRHSDRNTDVDRQGFFEDNARVRAQKFMKVQSDGYLGNLESLAYTGHDLSKLQVGDQFSELGKHTICRKYVSPHTRSARGQRQAKRKNTVETPLFHQHVDTEQFRYFVKQIPVGSQISFTAKMHGTSARYTHTMVERELTGWRKAWARIASSDLKTQQWEHIAGTRRVVLYQADRSKVGWNGPEAWRIDWLDKLSPYLDRGVTVYGEIVGYANGSPIMGAHSTDPLKSKEYTKKYGDQVVYKYGCQQDENELYVYRVTLTTVDGTEMDLSVDQMNQWCVTRGFRHVKEIHPRIIYDGDEESLREIVDELTDRPDVLTEDYFDASHVNEGVVLRVDTGNLIPAFYKHKSWAFKVMEGIFKEDNVDVEDAS